MRTMAVSTVVLALVLGYGKPVFGQPPATDQKPKAPSLPGKEGAASAAKPAAPGTLAEMLAQALQNHADIRVAEAKVREADALLEQARLQVAQKVITHYHTRQAQKLAVEKAEATLARVIGLEKARAISAEEFQAANLAVIAEKAKLAELEAQTPLLLGNKARSAASPQAGTPRYTPFFAPLVLDLDGRMDAFSDSRWVEVAYVITSPPRGSLAERICKALDTPMMVDYKDRTLDEILKDVKQKIPGVSFLDNVPQDLRKTKQSLHLSEQVPLGAALQALSDETGLRFAARDYGILVTVEKLPAGAVPLHEFWKSDAGKEKPKPGAATEKGAPRGNVEGVIRAVDEKSGLVSISIGSDAGLEAGHTLEVFRLGANPKYLGTLKVLEVRPTDAFGKPATPPGGTFQVGDRVASKIVGH